MQLVIDMDSLDGASMLLNLQKVVGSLREPRLPMHVELSHADMRMLVIAVSVHVDQQTKLPDSIMGIPMYVKEG